MTRERAHILLDAVRRGWPIPEKTVMKALVATGDVDGWWRAIRGKESVASVSGASWGAVQRPVGEIEQ